MKKRRQGFNLIWRLNSSYIKKIGWKKKGEYEPDNQHAGKMFALPREVSLSSLQAGTIMRNCYKAGATKSQLETIRKTLSYAFQLTTGLDGNYEDVGIAWSAFDPRKFKAPTQSVMPVRIIPPRRLADAFTTEWSPNCGMDLPAWCVGENITWDWCINGDRPIVDLKKMKFSNVHEICAAEGWMRTEFVGGRSKLENKKGTRDWWGYRCCLCPEGKHVPPPADLYKILDARGNPTEPLTFCTSCPLNAVDIVFRLLPSTKHRLYPRWLPKSGRFSEEEGIATERLTNVANQWLRAQGANPDVENYCSNGGRKALAKLCTITKTPFNVSFEVHGDLPKTWTKHYEPGMKPVDRSFRRRTQSKNVEECTVLGVHVVEWTTKFLSRNQL